MTDAGRNRILWVFLMASFGLNGALLAYLARIGTFERALVVADLIDRRGDDSEAAGRSSRGSASSRAARTTSSSPAIA